MTPHEGDVVDEIAKAIRRYVDAHPDAADSIDGIHRWWLLPVFHDEARALVTCAVDQLAHEGALRQVALEDGRVIYSSARRPV